MGCLDVANGVKAPEPDIDDDIEAEAEDRQTKSHLSRRALVEEHRQRSTGAGTLTGLAADIAALRTAIEAVATRVRHHEEQFRGNRQTKNIVTKALTG